MAQTITKTNGEADKEALALLRESATPELYQRNGFRVLELPVDSSTKDINRRKQMMEMAATNGVPIPPGHGRFFPLDPAPDEFSVRDAVQRLGDPEHRLVDEFFWFWPHDQGHSKSDQSLQFLVQGNHERASEIWSQQESNRSVSHVSTHNLAVMHHLLALQWENHARSNDISGDEQKNIEQLWTRAFRRWQRLLDEDGFWSRLTARVREFEDPRLTAGTVRRLRTALPATLLSINARLVLQAVEQGKKESAMRLVQVIRTSGFAEEGIKSGLRQAVEPVRARIKALCKVAQESAEADPVHADKACRQLLDNVIPLLDGLDCLLPAGDPARDIAHDDVADQALKCQVAFAKKTHGWKISVELLEMAAVIAASKSLSKTLQENLDTVKKHADTNDDFCGAGYYDLPEPILTELEAARKLAEGQDHDGAISRLETLLSGKSGAVLQTEQVLLVNKALAYCLGTRSARRRNAAIDAWNSHRSSVIDDIVKRVDSIDDVTWMCANMETIPPGMNCRCMADGNLIYGQYTIMKWTFKDKPVSLVVCGSCGSRHRSQINSARSSLKDAISKSAQDYVDAGDLDPTNNFIRNALERIRKECADLEISMPSPSRRKTKQSKGKPAQASPVPSAAAAGTMCKAASQSLGWGLAGILLGVFGAIPAIVLGHKAMREIKASSGRLSGQGRAKAGLILGYTMLVIQVITLIAIISSNQ
jgi:hypothetical protein